MKTTKRYYSGTGIKKKESIINLVLKLLLSLLLLHQLLAVFIEQEIIKDASLACMILENLEHLKTLLKLYLRIFQTPIRK
jgi:hypothetical protein